MNMRRSAIFVSVVLFVDVLLPVQSFALERLRPGELLDRVRQARESTPPLSWHLKYTITADYEDRPDEREYMEFVVDVYFDTVKAGRRNSSRYWRGQNESTPPREQFNQEIWDGQRFYSMGWWSPEPGVKVWGGGTGIDTTHAARLRALHSGAELTGVLYGDVVPYYDVLIGAERMKVRVDTKTFEDIPTYRLEATTERGVYQLWIDPAQDYHIRKAVLQKGASDLGWDDVPMSELEWRPKESVTYTLTNTEFETFDGLIFPTQGRAEVDSVFLNGGPGGSRSSKGIHEIRIDSIELNPDFDALRAFVPDAPPNTLLTDWSNDNSPVVWTGSEISDDEALILEAQSEQQAILRANIKPRPDIYDEQADRRELIGKALEKANQEGKRVIIVWGADWCGWCQMLDRQWQADAEIQELVANHYVLVHIDLSNRDDHTELALEFDLDLNALRTPHITILGEDDKPIVQKQSSSLVTFKNGSTAYSEKRIARMLKEHRRESK